MLRPLLAVLLLAAPAAAQPSASAPLEVQVMVVEGLAAWSDRGLDFGVVGAGSGTVAVPVTSPSAGLFRISGRRNRWVSVTLEPPAELTHGSGEAITYTWQAASNGESGDPATATPVTALTSDLRLRDFTAPGNRAWGWVWVYGSVDLGGPGTLLPPGTYSGLFTIVVAYL